MKVKVKPLGDRVLVMPSEAETKTAGGLYIPDSATDRPNTGVVVAVGDGRYSPEGKLVPMTVKVGDVVLYSGVGTEVKNDGKTYRLMSEVAVQAILPA